MIRNKTTDVLASQLTTAFVKSGLTTDEFIQHIIDTREPIEARVDKIGSECHEYASIIMAMPSLEGGELPVVMNFYKHHNSNKWGAIYMHGYIVKT